MTEDRKNTEQQDVEGHTFSGRFDPSEEPQDVEGHVGRYVGRTEDAPPAKPGTEGRDDDVEAHRYGGI